MSGAWMFFLMNCKKLLLIYCYFTLDWKVKIKLKFLIVWKNHEISIATLCNIQVLITVNSLIDIMTDCPLWMKLNFEIIFFLENIEMNKWNTKTLTKNVQTNKENMSFISVSVIAVKVTSLGTFNSYMKNVELSWLIRLFFAKNCIFNDDSVYRQEMCWILWNFIKIIESKMTENIIIYPEVFFHSFRWKNKKLFSSH